MAHRISHPLRNCHHCGKLMEKTKHESWPSYNLKTGCSRHCIAVLREAEKKNKSAIEMENISAVMALDRVVRNWRIAE